ncbi:phenylalanine--tRNA ligase subunit beta [Buchnera aphidicola (Thelaxes californica)]|uniref:Phenylalanine--tRNA ligase beta subunit n=1 Tax=Buchnera aphidicola (Thelaxes californica) TaxID=1315998 RepID=A0A4D6YLV6_9GAMM|nr:phenylalanine--tRNA ligase subunit beta [Buchnera aphidicola]QCI26658.1 phenylalanine--tRNA ligase subunit beta [Buchnera aphidicola (Thelaxes californica)]
MKFSEAWLKKKFNLFFIRTDILCQQLTQCGFEVEEVVHDTGIDDQIIVGKILSVERQIKKKNVFLYKILIGNNIVVKIISDLFELNCFNKVAVMLDSNLNIENNKNVQIKKFCSYSDLHLMYGTNRIILFPNNAQPGELVKKYFIKKNNNIIKVNIPPNRSDVISLLGLARELSSFNNINLPVLPSYCIREQINCKLKINIEKDSGCKRYIGRIIKNINAQVTTPFWMQERLRNSGVYTENVILDIINYVLIEIGEPVHIINIDNNFDDLNITKNKKIENVILPNGVAISLKTNISIISQKNKILLLSNNINLQCSSVKLNTKNIFIGSACLTSHQLSQNCFQYDMLDRNELYIYKRSVNIIQQEHSVNYTTFLIHKICGGEIGPLSYSKNITYHNNNHSKKIFLCHVYLNKILGFFVNATDIYNIFFYLGYNIVFFKTGWFMIPPYWRKDVYLQEDLIADFIRLYGYDKIPMNILPNNNFNIQKNISCSDKYNFDYSKNLKLILMSRGYSEVINYSFINPDMQYLFNPNIHPLMIKNPISKDMSSMRCTLWIGLIISALYNQKRQKFFLRLFEIGLCFIPNKKELLQSNQIRCLSGLITGLNFSIHWNEKNKNVDFYHIKGDIEALLIYCGIKEKVQFVPKPIFGLNPNISAYIYLNEKKIGKIGALDLLLEKKFCFKNSVFLFELFLDKISFFSIEKVKKIKYFPRSQRDISIIISKSVTYASILRSCKKSIGNEEIEFNVFDVYQGNHIESGKKSISINLLFLNLKGDLNEKKINILVNNILSVLKNDFNAVLRT